MARWRGGERVAGQRGAGRWPLATSIAMGVLLTVAPCLIDPLLLRPTAREGQAPVQESRARAAPDPFNRHLIALYAHEVGLRGCCA